MTQYTFDGTYYQPVEYKNVRMMSGIVAHVTFDIIEPDDDIEVISSTFRYDDEPVNDEPEIGTRIPTGLHRNAWMDKNGRMYHVDYCGHARTAVKMHGGDYYNDIPCNDHGFSCDDALEAEGWLHLSENRESYIIMDMSHELTQAQRDSLFDILTEARALASESRWVMSVVRDIEMVL